MTTAGSYVFRWTIANAPCTDSQDDVTVVVGICAYYSRATGIVTDPIWSDTPAGTAGAATFSSSTSMIVQSPDVVTNTANVMVNNVTVDVGGTLVLTGGTTFTANGTTNAINGTLTANDNSALVLTGNVATTFAVVGTPSLWDLTIANLGGVTATGNIDIRGTLQLSYGNLNASAAAISLGSTATETGRLGPVGPTASYTGNMRIERHIPTGNADWRLLGSPITGRTVNDWAADFITAGFPGSAYPNFDNPVGSNILWPSIRWYDETDLGTGDNDGMTGVSSNLQALLPGQGFAAFVGDDFSTVNAFEIDLRNGAPVIASTPISLPMTYTNTGNAPVDGWNLVSNPLPSAIAFDQISRGADIGDQVTYYNPVTGNTGVWDISLNFGTNGATNTIQSMQGFFLKATGPAVTTTVDESDKVNSNAGGIFGTTNEVPAHLRLNLTSSINTYSDETVVLFAEGTPIMDVEDALKYVFANDESPQIASIAPTGEQFAINAYGAFPEGFTIPVSVNVAVSGTYTITLTEAGDVPMTCLVLEDTENGTFTVMDNGGTYSFEIDAMDDETIARFILRASAPIAFSSTNALCGANPNGTASVDVPVGPADVIWTDDLNNQLLVQTGITGPASINDLGPGGYMVHVYTSTLCGELVQAFTIEAPFVLEAQGTTTDATCADTQNGTVDLIPLGGTTPYNFLWSDANSSSSEDLVALPGAYTVTITDANGCAWTSNAYVIGDQGPDGTFGTSATTVLVNVPVLFNGNDAGANYAWDFGDGNTSSEMAPAHSWTLPGVYTVTLTVTSGLCTVTTTVDITVDLNTGVTNVASSTPTHVWGTTQWIFVEHGYSSSDPLFIEVLDATGRLQNQRKVAAAPGRITLPAEGLSTGVWFVRLTCGDATETFRVPVVR